MDVPALFAAFEPFSDGPTTRRWSAGRAATKPRNWAINSFASPSSNKPRSFADGQMGPEKQSAGRISGSSALNCLCVRNIAVEQWRASSVRRYWTREANVLNALDRWTATRLAPGSL